MLQSITKRVSDASSLSCPAHDCSLSSNQAVFPKCKDEPSFIWHLSVLPGTYPSGQRCCAASASHSGRTKGATLLRSLKWVRPTHCVLLESQLANGLRPSFAQASCKECASLRPDQRK